MEDLFKSYGFAHLAERILLHLECGDVARLEETCETLRKFVVERNVWKRMYMRICGSFRLKEDYMIDLRKCEMGVEELEESELLSHEVYKKQFFFVVKKLPILWKSKPEDDIWVRYCQQPTGFEDFR